MSHSYEKISSNQVRISFEVPADEFDEAIRKVFLKVRKDISVPGFRRGKAPRVVVEQLYGKGVFYEDAFEELFPTVYDNAVEELDLKTVDSPHLEKVDQMGEGQDLKFSVTVYVFPDVALGQYKGLEVEITPQKLTDEMIDSRIEQDRESVSRAVEVEDRPVQIGDTVNIDYAGTVDGVPFEGGTAEDQELEIGSGKFIPGFEEQLIGMNTGEEKDLNVTFPDPYTEASLAGKEAVFHVKVNVILATEKPELDDEFAGDVSDFGTFEEYKADVVRELTKQVENNNRAALENAALEKAVQNAELEVPPVFVDNEVDNQVEEMRHSIRENLGMSLESYLGYYQMKLDDLKNSYRRQAEERVRRQLVIGAIRKAENIEADEEDIEAAIKEQAEALHEDLEDFKAHLTDAVPFVHRFHRGVLYFFYGNLKALNEGVLQFFNVAHFRYYFNFSTYYFSNSLMILSAICGAVRPCCSQQ